jgi:hypothetical protein
LIYYIILYKKFLICKNLTVTMGLLTQGTPLSWKETIEHLEYIKV